jgi:hypothetical protein
MVRSFAAFGAKKPRCLEILELWEEDQLAAITSTNLFPRKKILRIIADWLDRALPYYESVVPGDDRLRKAIDGIRRGLHGKYMVGLGNKVRKAIQELEGLEGTFTPRGPLRSTPYQAGRVAAAVVAGTDVASARGSRYPRYRMRKAGALGGPAEAIAAADAAAQATELPLQHERVIKRKRGQRMFQRTRIPAAERRWQIAHALKVLSEP